MPDPEPAPSRGQGQTLAGNRGEGTTRPPLAGTLLWKLASPQSFQLLLPLCLWSSHSQEKGLELLTPHPPSSQGGTQAGSILSTPHTECSLGKTRRTVPPRWRSHTSPHGVSRRSGLGSANYAVGSKGAAGAGFTRTQSVKSDRPRFKSWLSHLKDELTLGHIYLTSPSPSILIRAIG